MDEFLAVMFMDLEVFGHIIPLLWVICAGLLALAVTFRAWSSVGVVALLASLSYLAPFVKS